MKKTVVKKAVAKPSAKQRAPFSPVFLGGLPKALDMRLVSLTKNKVVGEMVIKPKHINRGGRVAGGALMSFADILGAVGAVHNLPPGHRSGTIESKTNFLASGHGPVLRGVSVPLHIGRTTSVWQTTITNTEGSVVSISTQTQIVVPAKTPEQDPNAHRRRAVKRKA